MPRDPAALEAFLARLYVDAEARARFIAEPGLEIERAGLGEERVRLMGLDAVGLELAARSFARKRADKFSRPRSLRGRLLAWLTTKSSLSRR